MTEKQYDLGNYVLWRPRNDGSHAVSFSVPENIRPSDWPTTISLPEIGPRRGSLNEAWFLEAVRDDAERLNAQLDEELRLAKVLRSQHQRDLRALIKVYRNDERYLSLGDEASLSQPSRLQYHSRMVIEPGPSRVRNDY